MISSFATEDTLAGQLTIHDEQADAVRNLITRHSRTGNWPTTDHNTVLAALGLKDNA